ARIRAAGARPTGGGGTARGRGDAEPALRLRPRLLRLRLLRLPGPGDPSPAGGTRPDLLRRAPPLQRPPRDAALGRRPFRRPEPPRLVHRAEYPAGEALAEPEGLTPGSSPGETTCAARAG